MTESDPPDFEALLHQEVERAVAPYEGVAPPFMLAKLRELAERYYREHPQASQILRLLTQRRRERSGNETIGPADAAPPAAKGAKEA